MNKNRIQGAAEQGERAKNREAPVVAGKTYWAWIDAERTAFKRENGNTLTTAGRCWAIGFNGNNPPGAMLMLQAH